MFKQLTTLLSKLPSIAWVILLPLGLIGFIVGILALFWAIATVEGFGSVIMVAAGWMGVWLAIRPKKSSDDSQLAKQIKNTYGKTADSFGSLITAGVIVWYAIMGMAIDQTGNPLFNYPLRWFCPAGISLNRNVDVLHLLPGRTDIIQNYTCFNSKGDSVTQLNTLIVIGVRFTEYVLIVYLFIAIRKLMVGKGHEESKALV